MAKATQNAQATGAPVSSTAQPMVKYAMPAKPDIFSLPDGVETIGVGDDTGRKNKLGQAILSKSRTVKIPGKPLGLSGDAALAKVTEIGKLIKPAIMGRVAAFSNQEAVIVRRYSETPGKRNKMSLTLEQVSVETTLAKLAREYGLTEEEVAKRLNVKPTEMAQ